MKHSKQNESPRTSKGWSKGREFPITIEDVLAKETPLIKEDENVRELTIRTDPTNEESPRITRRIKVLDNPTNVLEVLKTRQAIREGLTGNAITTGPNQYRYVRVFLEGEALRVFNEHSTRLGTETVPNLETVLNELVKFFSPRECLRKERRYMRYHLRKPRQLTTRQYVGSVRDFNSRMAHMPPNFNINQIFPESELVEMLSAKAPKTHKKELITAGFNPDTDTLATYVEVCERAETRESIGKTDQGTDSDGSDRKPKRSRTSNNSKPSKNDKKTKTKSSSNSYQFCKLHKWNDSHATDDCKVLASMIDKSGKSDDAKPKFKKYDKKKYSKDLHTMEEELNEEKKKFNEAWKKLQAKKKAAQPTMPTEDDDKSEQSVDSGSTPGSYHHVPGTPLSSSSDSE
jgi:hypothetical protein